MSKFRFPYAAILLVTIPILLVTLCQAITFRLPDVYNFYFNDSQVTNLLYTDYSNAEIADEIAGFMGSILPDEFQIYEDNGYDVQGIFSEEDSYNMMRLKKYSDWTNFFGLLAGIITVVIYVLYLRNEDKYTLRMTYPRALVVTVILALMQWAMFTFKNTRNILFNIIGWEELPDNSCLQVILGDGFWGTFSLFLLIVTVVVILVATYINYRLTKPPRIFF